MSLKSEPYYWLECERCGVTSTDGDDFSAYSDENGAREAAEGAGWENRGGLDYCEDCQQHLEVSADEVKDEVEQ